MKLTRLEDCNGFVAFGVGGMDSMEASTPSCAYAKFPDGERVTQSDYSDDRTIVNSFLASFSSELRSGGGASFVVGVPDPDAYARFWTIVLEKARSLGVTQVAHARTACALREIQNEDYRLKYGENRADAAAHFAELEFETVGDVVARLKSYFYAMVRPRLPEQDEASRSATVAANGGVFSATEPLGESHVASVVVSGKSLFETFGWADDGNALDGTFRMTVSRPEEFGADQVSDARTLATELFDAWDVRMNDVSPVGNERQAAIQKAAASLELAASSD